MNNYLIGAAMIAATGLIIWASHARADPPANGWQGSYYTHDGTHLQPLVVCKKAEDVKAIFDAAQKGGFEDGGHKAVALMSDQSCENAVIEHVTIVGQEYLGEANDKLKGQTERVWSVQISTTKGVMFCYFEEVGKDTSI